MNIVLLNSSIITSEGVFSYEKTTLEKIKEKLKYADNIISTIGHESIAQILSELFNFPVEVNRIKYCQSDNDLAIVFQLKSRPPKDKILSCQEIQKRGYDFFILKKIPDYCNRR